MPTVEEIFAEMPNRIDSDKLVGLDMSILFDLSGDGGGQWTLTVADGAANVTDGPSDDPTATLKMVASDYQSMALGKLNPMTAFMTGKVKVEGDLSAVMKMQSFLPS
ncbi:MAG: SCP2 sterol-binding domain-containing protein [Candidatus Promineifilaceae bacterium]